MLLTGQEVTTGHSFPTGREGWEKTQKTPLAPTQIHLHTYTHNFKRCQGKLGL